MQYKMMTVSDCMTCGHNVMVLLLCSIIVLSLILVVCNLFMFLSQLACASMQSSILFCHFCLSICPSVALYFLIQMNISNCSTHLVGATVLPVSFESHRRY